MHCVQGTDGAALHPALDTEPIDAIVDKGQDPGTEGYSGFDATGLAERLRDRGVDELTIVGLATDYCVKNTALDALREGFGVRVDPAAVRGVDVERGRLRARPRGAAGRGCDRGVAARARGPRGAPAAGAAPHVDDPRVLTAIREVPRDRFVPARLREEAWENVALPIGSGQTISQPLVVARMCELLELRGDERVLDVGTGSGYHAAVLARLVAHVWSVEVHPRAVGAGRRRRSPPPAPRTSRCSSATARSGTRPRRPTTRSTSPPRWPRCPPALPEQLAEGGRLVGPGRRRRPAARAAAPRRGRRAAPRAARARALRAAGQRTGVRRGLGRYSRPTFAHGRPSTSTTSAVKSLEPRISAEPTP